MREVSIVIAPAYLRAPACRHGLLARQRAISSRKEQQAFLALLVVTPLHPIQPLSFPRSLLPTSALDQRQPRSLAASKTTDLSTFFNRVKTRRRAAGHDLVAGVASIIEIRSREAGSWLSRGFTRGTRGWDLNTR